jgi:hypothetical protein
MKTSTPAIDLRSSAALAVPGFFIHSRPGRSLAGALDLISCRGALRARPTENR